MGMQLRKRSTASREIVLHPGRVNGPRGMWPARAPGVHQLFPQHLATGATGATGAPAFLVPQCPNVHYIPKCSVSVEKSCLDMQAGADPADQADSDPAGPRKSFFAPIKRHSCVPSAIAATVPSSPILSLSVCLLYSTLSPSVRGRVSGQRG